MALWMTDTIHHIPLPVACVLGSALFLRRSEPYRLEEMTATE